VPPLYTPLTIHMRTYIGFRWRCHSGFTCLRSPSCQTRTKPEPYPKLGFGRFSNPKPGFGKKLRFCSP